MLQVQRDKRLLFDTIPGALRGLLAWDCVGRDVGCEVPGLARRDLKEEKEGPSYSNCAISSKIHLHLDAVWYSYVEFLPSGIHCILESCSWMVIGHRRC